MPATTAHIPGFRDGKRCLLAIHTPSRGSAYLLKLAAARPKGNTA